MSPNRRGGDAMAGAGRRTSPCVTSVLNLGSSPRVPQVQHTAVDRKQEDMDKKSLPAQRDERKSRPSHRRIMSLLSMAVIPEERAAFRKRFREASMDADGAGCCKYFCKTPIPGIASAFGREPFQLHSAADMFPESRIESEFLNEFYIMDVVLNRAPAPAATGDDNGEGRGMDIGKKISMLTMTWYVMSFVTRRRTLVRRRIICMRPRFCSYHNVGYSTAIGNVAGEMSVCRAH